MPLVRKILIVDDQPINRQILCKLLCAEYDTISASNGKEALDILHKEKLGISAILLDIVMPILDGYSVLAELKKDEVLCNIPVIVATQKYGDKSEEKALSLGASDFVTKPYKPEIIRHRLRNLINMHEARETVDIVEKDILTGLLNKEAFYHKASEIILQNPKTDYDIIALDVERFKLINDTYGIHEGDKLLKYIAGKINKISETEDCLCARTNADKFIVLMKRTTNCTQKTISDAINNISDYPLSMKIHIKFGIYEIDDRSIPVTSMCDRAILAANEAKGQYGKSYTYYDDSIRKRLVIEQRITDEMNTALVENQFKVFLQPKYDLVTENISGAEALVRWIHPEWGFMSPAQFIPIFERNGFITELDIFVWDKTCEIIAEWINKANKWVPVSVNVSRKDIYNENLPEILINIVKKHGLQPKNLHLEITETAYTEDSQQLIDVVTKLKELGFTIEMDDFGSGYSSLNMLSELPIDILKLDMNFIQTKNKQNRTKNIMSFIIGLAKWLNLFVVAEGVETKEQVDVLKKLNCNYVQGYYFARPMKASEFTEMLLNSEISSMINPNDKDEYLNHVIIGEKTSNKTMLIVDDLALNRAILSEYFSDSFTIVEASNGEVAWKYIKDHSSEIDIIMLDLIMPVMDGYKLLEKLNNSDECRSTPVIVTSQAGEISEAKALFMGAADFMAKPYSKEVAVQRVLKVLSKSSVNES
ncbi:MAG: EAL domain-containing protein [Candidatus Metalachnospira sp.]|nr:EAL domain-containing protein [Candidatus Metalachnospira sp.]